jgi:hypothetical protein
VFVRITAVLGPHGVLAAVYIIASLFTETVTNNAAATLVFTNGLEFSSRSLPENSVVDPRASVFSSDKDGDAGDVGFFVDAARRTTVALFRQWL